MLDNFNKGNKFLERHKLVELSKEEIGNLNRPILSKKIELVVKTIRREKLRPRWFRWQFLPKHFLKELILFFTNFCKIQRPKEHYLTHCEVSITLTPKSKTS
jgi:hypothetical protein